MQFSGSGMIGVAAPWAGDCHNRLMLQVTDSKQGVLIRATQSTSLQSNPLGFRF